MQPHVPHDSEVKLLGGNKPLTGLYLPSYHDKFRYVPEQIQLSV